MVLSVPTVTGQTAQRPLMQKWMAGSRIRTDMPIKPQNGLLLHLIVSVCLCMPVVLQSQQGASMGLESCKVTRLGPDGQPSTVRCGARLYRVITQGQARECTDWARDCPRWEKRSLLLDRAKLELQSCLVDASEAEDQARDLAAVVEGLRADLLAQQMLTQSRWTTLELVGLSSVVLGGGLLAGLLAGLFSF